MSMKEKQRRGEMDMSELKEHQFCESDEFFREYHGPLSNEMRPYYLKYEADKVIADKDKEIHRLENLCESYRIDCDNLAISEANAYKEIERDNKRIRHQKYKRCLAMAEWCDAESDVADADGDYEDMKWYQKWHNKWLELAEKFEEASR